MDKRKTHVALCWDELGEGAKWGVFFDGDAEPFAYLTEAPEARVLPWLKEANAAPELVAKLGEILQGIGPDTHEADGRYECRWCGREWSAMCGDNEVPENCPSDDCPGHKARQLLNTLKA
jgi:hypothetical protein